MPSERAKVLASLLLAALALAPRPTQAQELSARATERCVRAAVRLEVDASGGTSSGSGTLIDPRGYVLTNLHVVGLARHDEHGAPGTLFGDGAHVRVATVRSARDAASPAYLGRVVRADVRLDLALVRIVSTLDGAPLPAPLDLPALEVRGTEGLDPGARVWAFGFPMGVRTINVTGGNISGFEMNARGEVAWIRTDVEFNPGNSGGMLVDRRGRLVAVPTAVVSGRATLEPIELARPAERIPEEWTRALAAGHLDSLVVSGMPSLRVGAAVTDAVVGDAASLERREVHYYALPDDRPATVTVTPAQPLGLVRPDGAVAREGRGSIALSPRDPPGSVLAVLVERGPDGAAVELSLRVDAAAPVVGSVGPPGALVPGGGASGAGTPGARAGAPYVASVRGALVDGATGAPVAGAAFLVARPGADLPTAITLFLSGRLTEAGLRAQLLSLGRTDASGAFLLPAVPAGSFVAAALAPGYATRTLTVDVPTEPAASVELGSVELTRAAR